MKEIIDKEWIIKTGACHQCNLDFCNNSYNNCILIKKEKEWNIKPIKVKYSTDANSQKESQEYICMNYEIADVAKMILPSNQKLVEQYF